MNKLICFLLLIWLPGTMICQDSSFTLPNGIEVKGKIHTYTRDSVTIQTPAGDLVTFHMNEISQKPTSSTGLHILDKGSKRLFGQVSIGLGMSAKAESLLSGFRFELEGLYRPDKNMYGFLTLQSGFEILQNIYPTSVIPIMGGYQGQILRWSNNALHFNVRMGYGHGMTDTASTIWENRTVNGGLRYEAGITMFPGIKSTSAVRIGISTVFQHLDYFINSEWSQQHIEQVLKRFYVNAGIVF